MKKEGLPEPQSKFKTVQVNLIEPCLKIYISINKKKTFKNERYSLLRTEATKMITNSCFIGDGDRTWEGLGSRSDLKACC